MKPPETELLALSEAFSGIPPTELSHLDHWEGVQSFFLAVETSLQAHWSGEDKPCLDHLSVQAQELVEAWSGVYIALYNVIRHSFSLVKRNAQKEGLAWFPNPGSVLASIILEDSLGALKISEEPRKSPRTLYDYQTLDTNIRNHRATEKQKKKMDKGRKLFAEKMKGTLGTRDFVLYSISQVKPSQELQIHLNYYKGMKDLFHSLQTRQLRKQMRS